MEGEKDYFVDFYAGVHGYHKYTAVFDDYYKGHTADPLMRSLRVGPE